MSVQKCRCCLCESGYASGAWGLALSERLNDFRSSDDSIEHALELAAETCDGWKVCRFILQDVFPIDWTRASELRILFEYVRPFQEGMAVRLRIKWSYSGWFEEDKRPFALWELFHLPDHPSPWSFIPASNILPSTTSSDETFETAKLWLSECQSRHKLCNRTMPNRTRSPPRLLDLSLLQSMSIVRIVDVTTESIEKYVCLSHGWGTISKPFSTTSMNIEMVRSGVLISTLPKTFQDAAIFTHRLGFQYLWIDSLCIIQDDLEDWKFHTRLMTDVYQNASLTLAATWGTDSHSGLFASSSKCDTKQTAVQWADKQYGPLYVRRAIPHWWNPSKFQNNDGWYRAFVDDLPLLERAWVFQERLLSRRIIHFTSMELQYECREELKCQCTHGLRVFDCHPKARHARVLEQGSAQTVAQRWRDIVTEYSKLDLSFESDRMPALLGIAKELQSVSPSRIIGGCWENNLFHDLLWSVNKILKAGGYPRYSASPCPSWSWVSAATGVYYYGELVSQKAVLVAVEMDEHTRLDDSIFMWVSLSLRTHLVQGQLKLTEGSLEGVLLDAFIPDGEDEDEVMQWIVHSDYDLSLKGPGQVKEGQVLYCALLAAVRNKNISDEGDQEYALVLRCVDVERRHYERLGCIIGSSFDNVLYSALNVEPTIKKRGTYTTFTLV